MEDKIDKEQLIEDLHFLSDRGNYKSIKYALERIDKLAKIERIIKDHDNDSMPEDYWYIDKIREVLNE